MPQTAIEVSIESVAAIAPQLRDELERWSDLEFGNIPYQWAPAQWYAAAYVDGRLAGSLTIVTREMTAGGERFRVAGIGNVVTKPEYRLQGVASAMLRAAADLMRTRLEVEFGLLICGRRLAPVYAKAGWTRVEGPTQFSQPSGMTTYPGFTMVLKLTTRAWPAGAIDLRGLPW